MTVSLFCGSRDLQGDGVKISRTCPWAGEREQLVTIARKSNNGVRSVYTDQVRAPKRLLWRSAAHLGQPSGSHHRRPGGDRMSSRLVVQYMFTFCAPLAEPSRRVIPAGACPNAWLAQIDLVAGRMLFAVPPVVQPHPSSVDRTMCVAF
jgi:hypothetical protein